MSGQRDTSSSITWLLSGAYISVIKKQMSIITAWRSIQTRLSVILFISDDV